MNGIQYHEQRLQLDGVSLAPLLEQFGSPLYVYGADSILRTVETIRQSLSGLPLQLCYAVKSNSSLAILQLLAQAECGADIVSGGELLRCLKAGVQADRIVFSGVGKTAEEMRLAIDSGIKHFNIESLNEAVLLNKMAAEKQKTVLATLRVNPDVDAATHHKITTGKDENKFGVAARDALHFFDTVKASCSHIRLYGLHSHIGSQIFDVSAYEQGFERFNQLVKQLTGAGHTVQLLDLGGGFGVDYCAPYRQQFDWTRYRAAVDRWLMPLGLQLMIEPGRYLVAAAGVLLSEVIYVKRSGKREFLIVDAAMNDLMRPSLYDAWHEIVPLQQHDRVQKKYDVVGPVCETGDTFALQRELPEMREGEAVAFLHAGAYGASMASNYNSRPLLAEVLVQNGKARLIRRRQTVDELWQAEVL